MYIYIYVYVNIYTYMYRYTVYIYICIYIYIHICIYIQYIYIYMYIYNQPKLPEFFHPMAKTLSQPGPSAVLRGRVRQVVRDLDRDGDGRCGREVWSFSQGKTAGHAGTAGIFHDL